MKKTVRVLLAVSLLGLGGVATSGSALADGVRQSAKRPGIPLGFSCGSPPTYDGYLFSRGYPTLHRLRRAGAVAVDRPTRGFHRRMVSPGVVFGRPRAYWW